MTTDHYPPKFGPGQIAQTSPNFRFCFVKRADLKKSSPKDFIKLALGGPKFNTFFTLKPNRSKRSPFRFFL